MQRYDSDVAAPAVVAPVLREHDVDIMSNDMVRVKTADGHVGLSIMLPDVSIRDYFTQGALDNDDPMIQNLVTNFVKGLNDIALFKAIRSASSVEK